MFIVVDHLCCCALAREIPLDSFVRAYLVFRGKEGVVKRCLKHMAEDGGSSHRSHSSLLTEVEVTGSFLFADIPFVSHWVHAHKNCCPQYKEFSGVHVVDIPFEKLMGMSVDVCPWCPVYPL